jgi:hypothetical protein
MPGFARDNRKAEKAQHIPQLTDTRLEKVRKYRDNG